MKMEDIIMLNDHQYTCIDGKFKVIVTFNKDGKDFEESFHEYFKMMLDKEFS
ncbi:hypothetical protein [Sinanaerobacter chloroacetimidivorans]|uniref:Uncharacterized protein n=1 Tax=Sinanaerobacter chloroacetimidivorans TaxID=2818044 RepID=A0A8J7W4R5_9FIRM|nr:hypothetical protein [Sinanaerobacter chloroacetimidivorans]MBR0599026.1 hypothetical protein [Sinanaerobacter chloroacetimidivorans]